MKSLTLLGFLLLTAVPGVPAKEQSGDLSPEQSAQLQRDKIIVTSKKWKQVFSPYIFAGQPVFITSDSALQAFYVLLEESMAQTEDRQAVRLPRALEEVLASIKDDPPFHMKPGDFPAAAKRARLVLGTAARLSGSAWSGGPELDGMIAAEVARVEAATEVVQPPWMAAGHGMAALDYRVFKPVSFYARSTRLQRYFRAVRWLQTVPFRARVPEEMAAAAVVAEAIDKEGSLPRMQRLYNSIGGSSLSNSVAGNEDMLDNSGKIASWRDEEKADHAHLTIMGALDFPDARVFQRSTNVDRPLPDVLEIGAWLGSPLAADLVRKSAGPPVLERIMAEPPPLRPWPPTVYSSCLDCMAKLLASPEPDAPPFMSSVPWQRKSLNTALGSWTQLRHAFALPAKMDAMLLPAGMPYPGFVEPNPAFFHALAQLILECVDEFDPLGALETSPDMIVNAAAEVLPLLEVESVEIAKRLEPYLKRSLAGQRFTEEELAQIDEAQKPSAPVSEMLQPLGDVAEGMGRSFWPGGAVEIHDLEQALASLREIAAGKRMDAIIRHQRRFSERTLRNRWLSLLSVVQQLETCAHRQLRGLEATELEAEFILNYGEKLGGIMFYNGNSYHIPRDDAPRVASVFHRAGGAFLLAGTGRAREIRVLYPWKGKEVLCRGAIVPFYSEPAGANLTDVEWKARLDDAKPPVLPEWMQPLLSPQANPAKAED